MYNDRLDLQSLDIVSENFEKLATLFPHCVTEGANGIGWFWRSSCLKNEYLIQVSAGQDFQHLCGWDDTWSEGNYETLVSALPEDQIPGVLPPLSFTWFVKKDCRSPRKS